MAPKLKKNWSSAKFTMNATSLSVWNIPASTPTARTLASLTAHHEDADARKSAAMRKPCTWIHLRPSFSIVKTVT